MVPLRELGLFKEALDSALESGRGLFESEMRYPPVKWKDWPLSGSGLLFSCKLGGPRTALEMHRIFLLVRFLLVNIYGCLRCAIGFRC